MWDWTENQVTTVWIRHGKTDANQERRYLGKTDEPLSEEGKQALFVCKEKGCYPKIQYLFSSPMARCLQTAEILYPNLRPYIIPEWQEIDFGRFELKNYGELIGDRQYQAWMDSGGRLPFPEGESRETFILRCAVGFDKMCGILKDNLRIDGQTKAEAGMIVHGGTIMALLSRYYGGNYFDYQAPNGGGYQCRLAGKGSMVRLKELQKILR